MSTYGDLLYFFIIKFSLLFFIYTWDFLYIFQSLFTTSLEHWNLTGFRVVWIPWLDSVLFWLKVPTQSPESQVWGLPQSTGAVCRRIVNRPGFCLSQKDLQKTRLLSIPSPKEGNVSSCKTHWANGKSIWECVTVLGN